MIATRAWSGACGRFFTLIIAVTFLSLGAARAEPVDEARSVIEQQLDAFERDAWDEAYAFASPGVKQSFPSVDRFSQMVREGYPMVWRPQDVLFLEGTETSNGVVQRVRLVGPDGRAYIATYLLQPGDEGWLIAGVYIEPAPGAA